MFFSCIHVPIYPTLGVVRVVKLLFLLHSVGDVVDLSEQDPNTVASLLKLYLRELPEPLIPHSKLSGMTENISGACVCVCVCGVSNRTAA